MAARCYLIQLLLAACYVGLQGLQVLVSAMLDHTLYSVIAKPIMSELMQAGVGRVTVIQDALVQRLSLLLEIFSIDAKGRDLEAFLHDIAGYPILRKFHEVISHDLDDSLLVREAAVLQDALDHIIPMLILDECGHLLHDSSNETVQILQLASLYQSLQNSAAVHVRRHSVHIARHLVENHVYQLHRAFLAQDLDDVVAVRGLNGFNHIPLELSAQSRLLFTRQHLDQFLGHSTAEPVGREIHDLPAHFVSHSQSLRLSGPLQEPDHHQVAVRIDRHTFDIGYQSLVDLVAVSVIAMPWDQLRLQKNAASRFLRRLSDSGPDIFGLGRLNRFLRRLATTVRRAATLPLPVGPLAAALALALTSGSIVAL